MANTNSTNKKPSKATVARTAVLVLTIVNSALAIAGKSPLPIENETVELVVSFVFNTGASLVAWWYNNSFSQKAIEADETFKLK